MRMKWWDIVVAVALAAMAGALVLSNPAPANVVVAAVSLGGILLAYLLLGRGLIARADTEQARPGLALVFLAIVGVLAAVGVAAEPNLASLQALLYPMLWMLSPSYGRAVVGSGVLALLIGVGLWASLGPTGIDLTASIAIVAGIQALSFAFSIALGTWITRISEDGAAAKELVAQLTQAQGEVAQLSAAAGAAAERERLSRDLHDTLTQSLTGLVMLAERAGAELHEGSAAAPAAAPAAAHTVALIERTARDALAEARALVASTHPLGGRGLAESLSRIAARTQDETGISVTVSVTPSELPRELEVVLLRAAQEGLANVRKHARAATARLNLAAGPDAVLLTVLDDGVGPAPGSESRNADDQTAGFGLAGMRERVALAGGVVSFGAAPGGGSLLRVSLPLPAPTVQVKGVFR